MFGHWMAAGKRGRTRVRPWSDLKAMRRLCWSVVFLLVPVVASGQEICDVGRQPKAGYALISQEISTVERRRILFLTIGLKHDKFTDQNLRQVVIRLKTAYCRENQIDVIIIDLSDKRVFDDLTPPPIFPPATRALYSLDRERRTETLHRYANEKYQDEIILKDE